MAVEANHFPSQLNSFSMKANQANSNMFDAQMDYGLLLPEIPNLYQSVKAESGITNHISAPKKRYRNSINDFDFALPHQKQKFSGLPSFLDQDIAFEIQQQQLEINQLLAEHVEKVRLELAEETNRQWRMLLSAIQEQVTRKLLEKDEQIQKMTKMNWVLHQKVKNLYAENQFLRKLAQTNEAIANSLRSNLEQVLAQVSDDDAADAESGCGSCDYGRCMLPDGGEAAKVGGSGRMCRRCGERESCVLLLPCRHLCLCSFCGSTSSNCPVCKSIMSASVHVNTS